MSFLLFAYAAYEQLKRHLANHADAIAELAEAAEKMLGMYVAMINSGDCGSWNPEDDAEVKALRAALARLEEGA